MESLRSYVVSVICCVLASGLIYMILPQSGRMAAAVRMTAATAVLVLLLTPVLKLSVNYRDIIEKTKTDTSPGYVELEEVQFNQTVEIARERFTKSVTDILEQNGITPKLVHIYVNTTDEKISISEIAVELESDATIAEKTKTERVITQVFGIEPIIKFGE